jgi:hypothetical protein
MATIKADKYIDNVQYLIKNIRAESERIAIANQDDIIDFVREEQMLKKGTDGNGFFLAKYRSTRLFGESGSDSRGFPKVKGKSFNLLETGTFFNSMVLKPKKKYLFNIRANVPYLKDILLKTGSTQEDLLGVTPENLLKINIEIIKKELDKWIFSKV